MTARVITPIVVVVVASLSLATAQPSIKKDATDTPLVQDDVRKIVTAVYAFDSDTLLSFTHPQIVELMGGTVKAREALASALAEIRSRGMTLERLSFPDAPVFVDGDRNEYVVVPTESIIAASGQRVRSVNFQFGVRAKPDGRWKYVEGSRVSKELLANLFQDFPSDYKFPTVARERM